MSRHTARARSGQDRTSLYQEITEKIIAELEVGRAPWVQPWGTAAAKAPLALPKNAATQRRYTGINVLILWGAVIEHGFTGQSWLTFRQALGLGGNVRKGERGTTVVHADRFTPEDERRFWARTTPPRCSRPGHETAVLRLGQEDRLDPNNLNHRGLSGVTSAVTSACFVSASVGRLRVDRQ